MALSGVTREGQPGHRHRRRAVEHEGDVLEALGSSVLLAKNGATTGAEAYISRHAGVREA